MKQLLAIIFCLLLSSPVSAEDDKSWWKIWKSVDDQTGISNALFTREERRILDDYLESRIERDSSEEDKYEKSHYKHKDKGKKHKKQKPLPPGLQKKLARGGELPPGWQKKVARGEVLDAELYESSTGLPRDILDRLPPGPDGTSIRHIGDKVVRILDATREILDVLSSS